MSYKLLRNLRSTVHQGKLEVRAIPRCPEIVLNLLTPDYPRGKLTNEEMLAIIDKPAYWAFCWASGQVTARFLLDNPTVCKHKTVIDFGSGSGVVSIAAALSGADSVIACDNDANARAAILENARLNMIKQIEVISDLNQLTAKPNVLVASDVLYDRDNLGILDSLSEHCDLALIADSRVRDPKIFDAYRLVSRERSKTVPDLDEFEEFSLVNLYERRFR